MGLTPTAQLFLFYCKTWPTRARLQAQPRVTAPGQGTGPPGWMKQPNIHGELPAPAKRWHCCSRSSFLTGGTGLSGSMTGTDLQNRRFSYLRGEQQSPFTDPPHPGQGQSTDGNGSWPERPWKSPWQKHLRVEAVHPSFHLRRRRPLLKLQLSRVHHGSEGEGH